MKSASTILLPTYQPRIIDDVEIYQNFIDIGYVKK